MSKLPPWIARSAREREAMIRWVNQQLNHEEETQFQYQKAPSIPFPRKRNWAEKLDAARKAADWGNLGPLITMFPYLEPYLCAPKLKKGQRRPPNPWTEFGQSFSARTAVDDVGRIHRLWKQCYGLKKRVRGQITAEEIAAHRNGVRVEKLRSERRKSALR